MKTLLALFILVAFLTLALSTYFRYDCGTTRIDTVNTPAGPHKFTHRIVTTTPFKDWKGHCYLRVRTEILYSQESSHERTVLDTSKATVTEMVFRMKPGPMTLVESR